MEVWEVKWEHLYSQYSFLLFQCSGGPDSSLATFGLDLVVQCVMWFGPSDARNFLDCSGPLGGHQVAPWDVWGSCGAKKETLATVLPLGPVFAIFVSSKWWTHQTQLYLWFAWRYGMSFYSLLKTIILILFTSLPILTLDFSRNVHLKLPGLTSEIRGMTPINMSTYHLRLCLNCGHIQNVKNFSLFLSPLIMWFSLLLMKVYV